MGVVLEKIKLEMKYMMELNKNFKIVEYEDKYLNDVRDLLTELEEYLVLIDEDNLDLGFSRLS